MATCRHTLNAAVAEQVRPKWRRGLVLRSAPLARGRVRPSDGGPQLPGRISMTSFLLGLDEPNRLWLIPSRAD
eukprot:12622266-Alexandrium_andersonii.AAC.1